MILGMQEEGMDEARIFQLVREMEEVNVEREFISN